MKLLMNQGSGTIRRKTNKFFKRHKKELVSLLIFVLAIVLIGLTYISNERSSTKKEEYQLSLSQLYTTKKELLNQKEVIESRFEKELNGYGVVSILVETLNEATVESVFLEMEKQGFCGILPLSTYEKFGENDCISEQRFLDLISSGWSYCFLLGENESIESGINVLSMNCKKLNLQLPKTIVFIGQCTDLQITKAYEFGFRNFVFLCDYQDAPDIDPNIIDIWQYEMHGWNSAGIHSEIERMSNNGGKVVLGVGRDTSYDRYKHDPFVRMLEELQAWKDEGEISVITLEEAENYFLYLLSRKKDVLQKKESELKAIEKQIETIEQEIMITTEKLKELN